ncbi:unnamed protein product [Cuscuta epithymum]|uniref:Uncharacterized protein n=1 Tax=Cuscuta epithymum TaxID=186058 RepID=A0AAV0E1B6_9ASTE|nr:unnamed protein product [Cuscuta epithymum]
MDDLDVLARDFGIRPGGKSAPMRSGHGDRRSSSVRSSSSSPLVDDRDGMLFNDVFGGPPKYTTSTNNSNKSASATNDLDYDSIFKPSNDQKNNNESSSMMSSVPVYDKPVYDDDIFDGLPGLKSKPVSSSARFDDDVFASISSPPKKNYSSEQLDDLLENLDRGEKVAELLSSKNSSLSAFDDLLADFTSASPATTKRPSTGFSNHQPSKPSGSSSQTSSAMDDPFVVLRTSPPVSSGVFSDPLEDISKIGKPASSKVNSSSIGGNVFDDLDLLNGFDKSAPQLFPDKNKISKESSPPWDDGPLTNESEVLTSKENIGKSSSRHSEFPGDSFQEPPFFDMPLRETRKKTFSQSASPPSYESANHTETSSQVDSSPRSEGPVQPSEDIWLTVSEIPLSTLPTSDPPPSRPPPPIPRWTSKSDTVFSTSQARRRVDDSSSSPSYGQYSRSPKPSSSAANKSPPVSQLDELEEFAKGMTRNSIDENDVFNGEEVNANTAAAAMKEAVDNAEAKFRHAKEVRERDYVKAARSKEAVHLESDDQVMHEMQAKEYRETQERLELERHQREKDEQEREQRRLERERELERERARQAVARATREARDRAAAGALEKAAAEGRKKAEKAAVEKASAEARERAERAAVQRAQAEARERAAVAARERANAETREREAREKEKADAESRRRAERAAVEKAAAEARERAAAEARERAARTSQQKNDNDLESFFSTRSSNVPKTTTPEMKFDAQFQNKGSSERAKSPFSSGGVSSNIKKVSPTNNMVDDFSSIFRDFPLPGEFQEVDGESEERRRARMDRTQRTQERAAKALAEMNQRDLQVQREQEERQRIAESFDIEIKRWAAGKEGNLRALLSTLQYVLWPECGWQPVSLTDLITGASVKKVYRKATLCIHPDKVQQKGATLQQKYVSEKVFDLLKEAWNKFNSEELF